MRHATPTPSAHRAAPAGALARFVRSPPTGQHRRSARTRWRSAPPWRRSGGTWRGLTRTWPGFLRPRPHRHLRREPYRAAHLLTRALAALIVLGILVMLGVLIVADDRRSPARLASAEVDERIASREVDPVPLTVAEVFPGGSAAFRVGESTVTADCTVAATGALRTALQRYGCSQAVRAALTVPYADYRITAGMLNLPDAPSAAAVGERVRELVETADGGFAEMAGSETGSGTPVLWRTRGHYVMYCVITGPAGELVPANAPQVDRITHDLLDTHLHDQVLVNRAG